MRAPVAVLVGGLVGGLGVLLGSLGVLLYEPHRAPPLIAPQTESESAAATFTGWYNRVEVERPPPRPCPDAALDRAYRETLLRSGVFGRVEHGAP